MNETIRELLIWAAKAAGIQSSIGLLPKDGVSIIQPNGKKWNPYADDSDALRLAVKLHLIYGINTDILDHYITLELPSDDPLAAVRLAIVRAAAEIGKQMP